ncbi:MAG: proline iminopeptidase-family hydrolase [Bacteroidota bacterium]
MKNLTYLLTVCILGLVTSCEPVAPASETEKGVTLASYFDNTGRDDVMSGGIKLIPVNTPSGTFNVWTKRTGNNPSIKVLLLHGGPGGTHEEWLAVDSYFPGEGIEYYYYDQLGSYYSDQPEDSTLWRTERFVEEVEQVRQALGLTPDNFYLMGQSWGGILAMEYALKYQENLKGLIISNMMASCPDYGAYAMEILGPQMEPSLFEEIKAFEAAEDFGNPRYMDILLNHHYTEHVIRMPVDEWPDPVLRLFDHINPAVYVPMQGPSEFGIRGLLADWDVTDRLKEISIPTLVIGAAHDTMDPKHMEWMASEMQNGRYLHCPNGSHLAQFDDPEHYFPGVIQYLRDVDSGAFAAAE